MKEIIGLPNLVILGAWNKAIFSVDWMKQNVYQFSPEKEINIEIPVGSIDSSLKFGFDKFSMVIVGNRLEFASKESTNEAFEQILGKSRIIARLLSHTPVSDFGINHRYQYIPSEFDYNSYFNYNDKDLVDFTEGKVLKNTQKTIKLSEIETLNIDINGEMNEIGFNYNYKINNLLDYFTVLKDSDTLIEEKKQNALSILENVYNLKL